MDLEIHQMDVSTAFLNGKLSEEIFMRQPDGYEQGNEKVCKLKKVSLWSKAVCTDVEYRDGQLPEERRVQEKFN